MENEKIETVIPEEIKNDKVLIVDNSPNGLLSQAIALNANIDTIERMVALQREWQKEENKKAYLKAFTDFQSEMPPLKKNKKVKYDTKDGNKVDYSYSELDYIRKQIQPLLKKHGFSFRFEFEDIDGQFLCKCISSHINGHSESSTMKAGRDTSGKKNDIQSIGSTRSYLERYCLVAVYGLTSADEDNDGKTSSKTEKKELIPAPTEKIDWIPLIKKCQTKKELSGIYQRMTEEEKTEHKDLMKEIQNNINASKKQ